MTRARHWAILLLAAGCILALAACGGPADGALPPPESPPATATPATPLEPEPDERPAHHDQAGLGEPPATATPTTPPEPEPEPEPLPATCTATTLGVDPATNPDLAADCAALLAAKDALRGMGALNWDAATALTGWDGVTLSGTPQRVTGLALRARQLTGTIPPGLADLNLTDLFLAENDLTGCLPRDLTQVARTDVAQLNLEPCELRSTALTYDTDDYAFLSDTDDLTDTITTYEGLRDGLREGDPIGLVINQGDHASFYELVEVDDLMEWREADDCWVRYRVEAIHDDPAGDPPRKLLTIQVYSYAFTGCTSGPITTTGTRTFTWTPESIRTGKITVPFYHGSSLIAPEGWSGTLPEETGVAASVTPWPPDPLPAPDLGPGWSGSVNASGLDYGYALFVSYRHESGGELNGIIHRLYTWPSDVSFRTNTPGVNIQIIHEWILIDGRPAEVIRWHDDNGGTPRETTGVSFYDAATGVDYSISSGHQPPFTDPEVLIKLARQFLPDAHPSACQPRAPASGRSNDSADLGLEDCGLPVLTLGYRGPPSRTGSITDAGDYAFLSDPDDLTSAITTYEGLRDGLREGNPIGLVLHQNESGGISQAAFYDLVRVGDLVQWWQAGGCWVRYQVTEVHPDPPGAPPRKLLTIQVYSYAVLGPGRCSGTILTMEDRLHQLFDWTPGVIRTSYLPSSFYHGPFLVVTADLDGPLPAPAAVTPIDTPWPPDPLPNPDLGIGWSGSVAMDYGDALAGYYGHTDGSVLSVDISRVRTWPHFVIDGGIDGIAADRSTASWIWEFRVIGGWPALVGYDPAKGNTITGVGLYDAASGTMYGVSAHFVTQPSDPEALIDLALQFMPDAP